MLEISGLIWLPSLGHLIHIPFYGFLQTVMNNDLLFYDIKRGDWKQVKSPGAPPPRCSHQAVVSAQSGGQMWVFGGEYASPSETQFHHYRYYLHGLDKRCGLGGSSKICTGRVIKARLTERVFFLVEDKNYKILISILSQL